VYKEPYVGLRWSFQQPVWRPPTDVYETDNSAVVLVEIAGLSESDFEISLNGRQLIITGERRGPSEKLTYQQMEIRYGRFRTQVYLPWAIDGNDIHAGYENGFLKVILRKVQARQIPIEVQEQSS
jgi:HSP20 family protein